jgi:hypothetical protein
MSRNTAGFPERREDQMALLCQTTPENAESGEDGFILPYVLGAIAALAAIASIAALAIQDAQTTTRKFDRLFQLQRALDDAERQAVFVLLTSPLVNDGINLKVAVDSQPPTAATFDETPPETPEEDLWRYNGETLELQGNNPAIRLFVEYRDPEGLLSLNSVGPAQVEHLLKAVGVAAELAASLSAKLADYIDDDSSRRFLGGERAEYRLARLEAPADSPIRTLEELGMVMGWAPIVLEKREALLESTTIAFGGAAPRYAAMPATLQRVFEPTGDAPRINPGDVAELDFISSRAPSQKARFIITALSLDGATGLRRVIETERRTMTAGQPFARRLIEERPLSVEEVTGFEGNVFSQLPLPAPDGGVPRRAPD